MANKKFQSLIEYILLRTFLATFGLLPYKFIAYSMAMLFVFAGKILRIRRSLVTKQLKMVFPDWTDKKIVQIADNVYYHLGITAAEVFFADDNYLFKRAKYEGFDYIKNALKEKQKIIFVSAHYGNWELGAKYVAINSNRFYTVVKKQRNQYFDHYINNKRLKSNIYTIPMTSALKHIFTALNNNYVVAFLVDQHANSQGIRIPFLGYETNVFTSVAKMALKTGAIILPCFDIREGLVNHRMIICEPIKTENLINDDANVLDITKKIMYTIEVFIKEHPEQWFWVHRRWRD